MARNYVSSMAACPFYRHEDPKKRMIGCEGPGDEAMLEMHFKRGMTEYRNKYCCDAWEKCPIARMLWQEADMGPMIGERYPGMVE